MCKDRQLLRDECNSYCFSIKRAPFHIQNDKRMNMIILFMDLKDGDLNILLFRNRMSFLNHKIGGKEENSLRQFYER